MLVTSMSYVVGWVIGEVALRRRLGRLRSRETFGPLLRMAAVSVVAGGVGWLVRNVTDDLVGTTPAGSLVTVLVGTVVIGGVALAGLVIARVPEIREPLSALRGRRGRG
jgi:putative peptidoglycan lipid II flippase